MYKLDVTALLQMLQEFQQNALLQTEIQSVPGARGRFYVRLSLLEGKIASCIIQDSNGHILLAGDDALQWLRRLGTLNWTLTLQQVQAAIPAQTPSPQTRSPTPRVFVPRRVAYITQEQINSWPRKYRAVFAMIDGKKSVEQIAGLLSLSVREVEQILYDLQSERFVALY